MKILHWFCFAMLPTVVSMVLCSATATAEDFAARSDLHSRSLKVGLGRSSIPLLARQQGQGAEAIAQEIYVHLQRPSSRFPGLPGDKVVDVTPRRARIYNEQGWSIVVRGDGSAVRVRNYSHLERVAGVKSADRLSGELLELLGRDFVTTELKQWVKLGDGEELVALKSEYQVEETGDQKALLTSEVVANTIVFSRRINDIDIVGPGSKVSVTFANDGTVVAFGFDWPEYQNLGRDQTLLDMDKLRERMSAQATMHFSTDKVELRRFECGYVDLGAEYSRRDAEAPIQGGCWLRYIGTKFDEEYPAGDQGSITKAISEPIPIGEVVEFDSGWPHVLALTVFGDICRATELTSMVLDSPQTQQAVDAGTALK